MLCDGMADEPSAVLNGKTPMELANKPMMEKLAKNGEVGLARTVEYAKAAGLYVILDVKRNDIGSTAEAYAAAYLGETKLFDKSDKALEVDCVTVNPYLGSDGIVPFVKTAAEFNKSMFILVKTSNPSSKEFQDIEIDGKPIYRIVGETVEKWGADYIGASGYSPCGAVVGATHPAQLAELREALPHTFFLIPGYGAQGGGAADVAASFDKNGGGAIVNSSRALMCAYKGKGDDDNFAKYTREAVIEMRDALNSVRGK